MSRTTLPDITNSFSMTNHLYTEADSIIKIREKNMVFSTKFKKIQQSQSLSSQVGVANEYLALSKFG